MSGCGESLEGQIMRLEHQLEEMRGNADAERITKDLYKIQLAEAQGNFHRRLDSVLLQLAEAYSEKLGFIATLDDMSEEIKRLREALMRVQAQFAGYALRIAPMDEGNDIILNGIEEALKGAK